MLTLARFLLHSLQALGVTRPRPLLRFDAVGAACDGPAEEVPAEVSAEGKPGEEAPCEPKACVRGVLVGCVADVTVVEDGLVAGGSFALFLGRRGSSSMGSMLAGSCSR